MLQPSFPSPAHAPRVEPNGPIVKIFLPDRWNPIHVVEAVDDGPPHDHPFSLKANVLIGGYIETVWVLTAAGGYTVHFGVERKPGTTHQIDADTIHLITGLPKGFSVTEAEPEEAKRPWFHYLPQEDGSVLRSPNWNGPWEDYHPAGPVHHVHHNDPQAEGIARLAPVAAAGAGIPFSQTVGAYVAENQFVIGNNNDWAQAKAALYEGHQIQRGDWASEDSWILSGLSGRILLVTGHTQEEWRKTGQEVQVGMSTTDMPNYGWIVLPKIHPEKPVV